MFHIPSLSRCIKFMLFWRWISIHPRNENQIDALFTVSLFRQSASTRIGHVCSPSSGCILCVYVCTHTHTHTGYTQKNGAVSKVNNKSMSHLTRAQLTPSAAANVPVSHALPAVRLSCLLRGRGASFQDGVAAGRGFLCVCVTQDVHIEGLWLTHGKLGQLPLLTVYVVPVQGEK